MRWADVYGLWQTLPKCKVLWHLDAVFSGLDSDLVGSDTSGFFNLRSDVAVHILKMDDLKSTYFQRPV